MTELTSADDEQRRSVVFPVTSTHDGLEHLVAEHLMTTANAGRYTGLCGRQVWAAVLTRPPGPPCPRCLAMPNAHQPGRRRNRRTARRGVWTRLTDWLNQAHRSAPR